MKTASFYFLGDLMDFLPLREKARVVRVDFQGDQSLKHLIESIGVPHTEVGNLHSLEKELDLGYTVQDGDHITVAPANNPVDDPRFLLDNHLGKLATYLRILGFDAYYQNNLQDEDLVAILRLEPRILLTRDRRLLMRKIVSQGYCVRSLDPETQACEVLLRYHLKDLIYPFHRCLRCNSPLEIAERNSILPRLQPLTKKYFDEFRICPICDQIYWKGSHYERMQGLINRISDCIGNE